MPDVSLNGIEFEIKGSTDAASSSIDNLIGKLSALNTALSEVANIKKLATGINSLKKAIDSLNSSDLDKIKASLESFGQVSESLSGLSSMSKDLASFMRALSKLSETPENVIDLAQALNVLGSVDLTNLQNAEGALRALADSLSAAGKKNTAAKAVRDVGREAKKADTPLKNFLASIKRIAFYRILRGILKSISQGFQEGLKNAYQFSKINGGALANSLDAVATKSLTMKNQLGAAFGGLLTAITPVVLQIISLVTRLASALSMVIAALSGSAQYKKAKDVWTEWGEAAGGAGSAAKEALRYLAPFDELNVLPDDSDRGGGGSDFTPDYGEMFDYEDVPDWLQGLSEKISEFVSGFKITFDDVFFDWKNITGEQIAEKVITGLGALLGAGVGFVLGGAPGAVVGTLVGTAVGLEISSLLFDHDGQISKEEIASMLKLALVGLVGGVIGFSVGGPAGALIGATVGIGIYGTLKGIEFLSGGKFSGILDSLVEGIGAGVGAVIGFKVGGPAGAVLGATIGLGISFGLEKFVFGDTSGWTTGDWVRNIVATLAPLAGAAIGLVVGGPGGALIGATIGLGIHFALSQETGDAGTSAGGAFFDNLLQAAKDKWELVKAWFSDNFVRGIGQFGIDAINELATPILYGLNGMIEDANTILDQIPQSIKEKLGIDHIPEIPMKLIPDLDPPVGTYYEQTKAEIEARSKKNPTSIASSAIIKGATQAIPRADKIIEATAKYTSSANGLSKEERTVSTWAQYNASKTNLSNAERTVSTWAQYNSSINALTKGERTVSTWARYDSSTNNLTKEKRTVSAWAKYNDSIDNLPEAKKTFDSTAKWSKQEIGENWGGTTWASTAKWAKQEIGDSWGGTTWDSTARFVDTEVAQNLQDQYGRIEVPVTASVAGVSGAIAGVIFSQGQADGGAFYGGAWHDIAQYATGGLPRHGTAFVAGEAGPEVVGHVGGRTEVLNQSQLAATMYAAVRSALSGLSMSVSAPGVVSYADDAVSEETMYRAFSRAIADSDLGGDIELDGDVLYSAMVNRNRRNTRLTGVNAMA